jgi:non-ribosomal peptide synthetase component E (peptide arylation enzyme)
MEPRLHAVEEFMSLNLASILRESAAKHPSKTAIVMGDAHMADKTLHENAQRFAAALAKARHPPRPARGLASAETCLSSRLRTSAAITPAIPWSP